MKDLREVAPGAALSPLGDVLLPRKIRRRKRQPCGKASAKVNELNCFGVALYGRVGGRIRPERIEGR
jgi:hypothetical protein